MTKRAISYAGERETPRAKKPARPRGTATLRDPTPKLREEKRETKEFCDDALKLIAERADEAYRADQHNIEQAYDDLNFLAGEQWPDYAKALRESEGRPMHTMNLLPQFVAQVTGDIDLQRRAIKVTPSDARGTREIGELIAGMIRYIENRSEAQSAYSLGADQQVACGIGALQVVPEYADDSTFNQELRIRQIDDGVSVLWDPNAKLPTREDAEWCLVPVDMTHSAFKAKYPDVPVQDFAAYDRQYASYWYGSDFVRVAQYWEKRPVTRTLAMYQDGAISDLTDADESEIERARAEGAAIRKRDGYKIYRSLVTLGHYLEEPEEWPGLLIPVAPLIGKEIRIGRKIFRYGIVRFGKEGQVAYNFARSAQSEMFGLAPKAPFVGTEKNFEDFEDEWATANARNHPFLRYKPDPANAGVPPQRQVPPMASSGISEAVMLAAGDIKASIGLYDASLGGRSNEVSGVAITARERQGDVGTIRYILNFNLTVRHIARILVDLIPHVYDTERQVMILDETGEEQQVTINRAMATGELFDEPDEPIEIDAQQPDDAPDSEFDIRFMGEPTELRADADGVPRRYINDVTIGAYAVNFTSGPSFGTRREENRAGMEAFVRAAPQIAPLVLDLYAKAQDWPLSAEIASRIETMLPPQVKAAIAQDKLRKAGVPVDALPDAMPAGAASPTPSSPADIAEQQADMIKAQAAAATAQLNLRIKEIDFEIRKLELAAKAQESQHP